MAMKHEPDPKSSAHFNRESFFNFLDGDEADIVAVAAPIDPAPQPTRLAGAIAILLTFSVSIL
jgi:hypothetical protein